MAQRMAQGVGVAMASAEDRRTVSALVGRWCAKERPCADWDATALQAERGGYRALAPAHDWRPGRGTESPAGDLPAALPRQPRHGDFTGARGDAGVAAGVQWPYPVVTVLHVALAGWSKTALGDGGWALVPPRAGAFPAGGGVRPRLSTAACPTNCARGWGMIERRPGLGDSRRRGATKLIALGRCWPSGRRAVDFRDNFESVLGREPVMPGVERERARECE